MGATSNSSLRTSSHATCQHGDVVHTQFGKSKAKISLEEVGESRFQVKGYSSHFSSVLQNEIELCLCERLSHWLQLCFPPPFGNITFCIQQQQKTSPHSCYLQIIDTFFLSSVAISQRFRLIRMHLRTHQRFFFRTIQCGMNYDMLRLKAKIDVPQVIGQPNLT